MQVANSVLDAIGNTPLIRLNRASELTGCEILAKAEFMNPGQSVKDRAALFMVRDAEAKGLLRPGGRIVEGTAGNTGIGLAMVAQASGYSCTIVIPRTQSEEKKDAIRLYGAELVEVDAVPYANEMNYVKYSGRLAQELDAKEPNGEGASISEGIGQGRITANLEDLTIDFACRVSDEDMLLALYDLVEHEGLVMGGSTGINVAGAIRMAKDVGPGKTIVTVLADN